MSKFKQNLIGFSILSVSLIIASGNAISPALPSMAKTFSNYPLSLVDMIGTVQQFAVMLALFVSVAVARKIGMKYTIMIGIFLVGISGILPMIMTNFWITMASRIILGLGIGFFNSLAIDIINVYYKKHEALRIKMCGIRTAFEPLGQCILNIISGMLVVISWHAAFLVYFAAIPIFLLYWKYVPNIKETTSKSTDAKAVKKSHAKVSLSMWGYAILLMFLVMCNTAITIEVPNIITDLHLGSATFSSVIISLNTFAAMLMGFAFSKVYAVLHQYTLTMGLAFIACGCLMMSMAKSAPLVILGAIICGISFPLSGTYTYALIGKKASKSTAALAISIVLVGCNMGSFLCPLGVSLFSTIGHLFTSGSDISVAFLVMFFFSILITIILLAGTIYHESNLAIKPNSEITKR